MYRTAKVIQLEVRRLQIESGAWIGQYLPLPRTRQDHSHASILVGEAFHAGNVDPAFQQTVHAEFAERITSDARSETDTTAQERDIVGKNRRRAAKSHREIVGQVFPLGFRRRRKAVENQVAIEFTQNTNVKTRHPYSLLFLFLQEFYMNLLLDTRYIFSRNEARKRSKAIRRSASHREHQAFLKRKVFCGSDSESSKSRVTAANRGYWAERRGPGVNGVFIALSHADKTA